jgi:hypothetical protein
MEPPRPGEREPYGERESYLAKRQRWSGLWNGVVIGMGLGVLFSGSPIGLLPLVLGIVVEVVQRRRSGREQ